MRKNKRKKIFLKPISFSLKPTSVSKIIDRLAKKRGLDNEERVESALKEMILEKKDGFIIIIRSYKRYPQYSKEDKKGKDFWIEVEYGDRKKILRLDFQVKSSQTGERNHIKRYGYKIPVLVVRGDEIPEIKEKILTMIKNYLSKTNSKK